MGRHQMAASSSSARARVALGALPLVATVGAIGVGSVVMSPTAAEAPLERPGGGVGAAAPLPFAPAPPGAPVTVLDLASTGGPVAGDPIVPGRALDATSTGRGDAEAGPRRSARAGSAGSGSVRSTVRDAHIPARGSSGGGGGGTVDRDDSGGGSSGGSGSSGSGGSGGSGSSDSGGSGGSGGGGGRGGGLLGGVVGGLDHTVSGATSLLSFGEPSSSSVLSFGS